MNYDNIINGKEIANNLRAERNRKKMTQEEVARKLDITLRTYVSYEEDASTVKAPTLYLLSKILNCNISDFFYKPTSQNVNIVKEKERCNMKDNFSERLLYVMKLKNIRQRDIANGANVSKSLISQYISGKFKPKTDKLYKIAETLNVSPMWLAGYDVPMSNKKEELI